MLFILIMKLIKKIRKFNKKFNNKKTKNVKQKDPMR